MIEFGEEQKYEGNAIQYLMKISQSNPTKAAIIQEEYMLHKDSE